MSVGLHHRAADAEAGLAVEEAAFDNIGAEKVDTRTEQPRQHARLLAALVVRLRTQFGEVELLFPECLGCVPRVMQQVAFQQGFLGLALEVQPLVDEAFPLGEAAPPDADFGLGIKPAALDPLPAIVVEAVHGEDLVAGDVPVFQCLDGMFEFVRKRFVGVDAEDEIAGGQVVGEVLLVGVAEPVLGEEPRAVAVADGLGSVGGMTVHDDDFIGNIPNGVKAALDVARLVESDDDDRKGVHGSNGY